MAMMRLDILVANLDLVIAKFDRIKIYRATAIDGTYAEITTALTRVVLIEGQQNYVFVDSTGDASYYYKTSYFNTLTFSESSQSNPQQGEDITALGVLSVEELKAVYLPGVNLTSDNGTAFDDLLYRFCIKSAVARVERELDIPIKPTRYVDEAHDYNANDYDKQMFLQTSHAPVIPPIETIKMVLPAQQLVQTFQSDWINLVPESGQINVIPGSGLNTTLFLSNGFWGPTFWGWGKFLPIVFRITYTAGFAAGQCPYDIKNVIGMIAACGPLLSAGELILGAGISSNSLSIDGLSQGLTSMASSGGGAYQARVKYYKEEIEKQLENLRNYYRGIRFEVL